MSFPPAMMSYDYPHPVSRTYQYKKITKPLLERKRRARINRCLDELKDLMVDALETEGENISKLEKADILELTVRHLQKLQASRPSGLSATIAASGDEISAESRWQSGFGHCAAEACRFLSSLPGEAAERLARHLATGLQTGGQTSSPPKANLLSPTLANLDRIASVVAPCPVGTSGEIDSAILSTSTSPIRSTLHADKTVGGVASTTTTISSTPRCRASMSLVNGNEKLTANCSAKPKSLKDRRSSTTPTTTITTTRNKTSDPHDINADDDEEIDVERVDERDPMWRPW
ncbi:enhancer of split mgamma protein-like [Temnothorax curvispinosus]|uniref:Enhancer of split mgamma protein-like n=1 Tax=Temnothorax curvispinosus TaxID=300111 RepID=A0A6J1QXB3_9HYME|nr:enhancer of split mgamma protein-like [Temnothorax curvispinosus]